MKLKMFKGVIPTVIGIVLSVFAAPAGAQFNAGVGGDFEESVEGRSRFGPLYGGIAIYPVAAFVSSGTAADGSSGTQYDFGRLTALDLGFRPPRSRTPVEFGGWFWSRGSSVNVTRGSNDLYQFHGRIWFTPTRQLGLQVAVLDSSRAKPSRQNPNQPDFRAYTAFLLHEFRSPRSENRGKRWMASAGVGFLQDNTPVRFTGGGQRFQNRSTTEFSAFVQGSFFFDKNLSFNVSEWYLRDRTQDLNRFALGIGYKF